MAKKASKCGNPKSNYESDQGCGSAPSPGGLCRSGSHCPKCYVWLRDNPGKILNKPKKKSAAETALDAKLATIRGDVYTLAGRHDSTRTRLDALAEIVEHECSRTAQLRTELTAALARISALEASANISASPKPENAATAKPGSDSTVSELTSEAERLGLYDQPAPGYRIVRSSVDIDPMKCRRWRWVDRGTGKPTSWFDEDYAGLDLPKHLHADWNRGDADCEVPAVPFRSSKERPPRVGDVFTLGEATVQEWTVLPGGRCESAPGKDDGGMGPFTMGMWDRGEATIIQEGPDPTAAALAIEMQTLRERAAWNAAIDAADGVLADEGWYREGQARLRINGLRK